MIKQKPMIDQEGEVRELEDADLSKAVPFSRLPASLRRKVGGRGPQKTPTKEKVTIRLSKDVVEAFRATGSGWQSRIDEALNKTLQNSADLMAAHLTGKLHDERFDLESRIRSIEGTLKNAHPDPSVAVQEYIEKAYGRVREGHPKEAERLIEKAIRAYQRGPYAA